MAAISTTPQTLDSTRSQTIAAKNADGTVYVFDGSEALSARLSTINGGPPLVEATVAFVSAPAGTLKVTIDDDQIAAAGLSSGSYLLEILAVPASGVYAGKSLSVWTGTIDLANAPSVPAASTTGWTRAKLEKALVFKRQGWMEQSGLDISRAGANQDLDYPIGAAIEFFGGSVADPAKVADADLATAAASMRGVLAVADQLLLEAILGNQASVTMSDSNSRKADWNDWASRIGKELARVEDCNRRMYGYGLAAPVAGVTDLDFQQTADDVWPDGTPAWWLY